MLEDKETTILLKQAEEWYKFPNDFCMERYLRKLIKQIFCMKILIII